MEKTNTPTAQEIDALAQLYVDAQAEADKAQGNADVFYEQLLTMTQEFGCAAPRSDKTVQIEGEKWLAKVTRGQSVQINTPAVLKIRKLLAYQGRSRIFRKLFVVEERYAVASGARQLIADNNELVRPAALSKLRALFTEAVDIKNLAPRLKVEPRKKEKE